MRGMLGFGGPVVWSSYHVIVNLWFWSWVMQHVIYSLSVNVASLQNIVYCLRKLKNYLKKCRKLQIFNCFFAILQFSRQTRTISAKRPRSFIQSLDFLRRFFFVKHQQFPHKTIQVRTMSGAKVKQKQFSASTVQDACSCVIASVNWFPLKLSSQAELTPKLFIAHHNFHQTIASYCTF